MPPSPQSRAGLRPRGSCGAGGCKGLNGARHASPQARSQTSATARRAPSPRPPSFNISARFVHDISVAGTEHGSVFMDGGGVDLNMDHHK